MIAAETLIVGAGLTGLVIADGLRRAGRDVAVLDKSRGLGGRLATRRAGDLRFDHGAQYLRPKDGALAGLLDRLTGEGSVAEWHGAGGDPPALVGLPGMSGLVRPLAAGIELHTSLRVAAAHHGPDGWTLLDMDRAPRARAARLVVAIPAPQAAQLLVAHPFAARAAGVAMDPCWTLMAAFAARPDLPETARDPDAPLAWIARDGGKPGRGTETWVAQASAAWTAAHLDLPREAAAEAMLAALRDRAGGRLPEVLHRDAHRWLYAHAPEPLGEACLNDPATGLVVAGDWCLGPRAEHAVQSAQAALAVLGAAD